MGRSRLPRPGEKVKTTLLVPTINEIIGVKAVMPQIDRSWVDEILIIDGNSSDGTYDYCVSQGYRVVSQKEPGVCAAWWEGFAAATGDIIILFSPDGNSDPKAIPRLVAKMHEGNWDAVIASRYLGGAKSHDDSFLTYIGNRAFTKILNMLFRSKYTDALVMYKAFKKSLLETLSLHNRKDSVFEVMFCIRCAKYNIPVTEIPADEPARIDASDSRVHKGLWGRIRGGLWMIKTIWREL